MYNRVVTLCFGMVVLCKARFKNETACFQTHLFTFLTSDKGLNRVLPGQLACDNQGAMAKVSALATLNRTTDMSNSLSSYVFKALGIKAFEGKIARYW